MSGHLSKNPALYWEKLQGMYQQYPDITPLNEMNKVLDKLGLCVTIAMVQTPDMGS